MPEPADGSVVGLALALATLLVMACVIAREVAAERSEGEQ